MSRPIKKDYARIRGGFSLLHRISVLFEYLLIFIVLRPIKNFQLFPPLLRWAILEYECESKNGWQTYEAEKMNAFVYILYCL